jgi:hypothetical protein
VAPPSDSEAQPVAAALASSSGQGSGD